MLKKLKKAILKHAELRDALEELEEGLEIDHTDSLSTWRTQVLEWEKDPTKPNPYERTGNGMSLHWIFFSVRSEGSSALTVAAVRLELAREEARDLERPGSNTVTGMVHDECTASVLISSGLELEEQQYVASVQLGHMNAANHGLRRRLGSEKAGLGAHATDNQEATMTQRCNTLQRRIDTWVKLQHLFLPTLAAERAREAQDADSPILPETFKLMLPSQLGSLDPCNENLQRIEWRLRIAQAHDALHSLRANLHAQTCVLKYKDRNLRGQGANTRAHNTVKAIESRLNAAANRYNDAHQALVKLAPFLKETGWNSILRPLARQDIRGLMDLLWGETEGTRKLSWIWTMGGMVANETDEVGLEGLSRLTLPLKFDRFVDMRIEWCKARARAKRWEEEVELLVEEMRRVLAFWKWDAARWDERGKNFVSDDDAVLEGHHAYAQRQATLRRLLAQRCQDAWSNTIALVKGTDGKDGRGDTQAFSQEIEVGQNIESDQEEDF